MSRGVMLVLLVLLLVEGIAWAGDPLAGARNAISESDYPAARAELAAVRDAGGCSPEQTAELYLLSGRVEAALGDTEAAIEAFLRLLVLSPTATLPPGTSPKLTAPFSAAASYLAMLPPLEIRFEATSAPPAIRMVVVSDPKRMIAKLRVVYAIDGGLEQTQEVAAAQRTEIPLPAGQRITARAAALDAHGNRLVERGHDEPIVILGERPRPIVTQPPPPPPPAPVQPAERPIYLRWWPYAAATVVFAGATAYTGWSAYSAAIDLRDAPSAREAQAIEDRGRRDTLLTNIGFGITGACAITAGAMYLLRPRARADARVTAVALPGGGAVVIGGTL